MTADELAEARQLRSEAERNNAEALEHRKAAEKALADADAARGQTQFNLRTIAGVDQSFKRREAEIVRRETEQATLIKREAAVIERENAVTAREAAYDRDRHAALRVLTEGTQA